MFRTITHIGLAAFIAASAITPKPAQAETVAIAISAEDLNSDARVFALYSRIQRRARAACGSMSSLHRLSDRNRCRSDLVAALVAEIGSPQLSALAGRHSTRIAALGTGTASVGQCVR